MKTITCNKVEQALLAGVTDADRVEFAEYEGRCEVCLYMDKDFNEEEYGYVAAIEFASVMRALEAMGIAYDLEIGDEFYEGFIQAADFKENPFANMSVELFGETISVQVLWINEYEGSYDYTIEGEKPFAWAKAHNRTKEWVLSLEEAIEEMTSKAI